jgi:hypothetical protein
VSLSCPFVNDLGLRLLTRCCTLAALENLFALGFIDDSDHKDLRRLYQLRAEIAHAASPHVPSREDIMAVLSLADRLAHGRYASADYMAEWLVDNFETIQARVKESSMPEFATPGPASCA